MIIQEHNTIESIKIQFKIAFSNTFRVEPPVSRMAPPQTRTSTNNTLSNWDELPQTVKSFGKYPEEIFSAWVEVKQKVGANEMKNVPFGAVAVAGYVDKLSCGLQQLMAGVRKISLPEISRNELFIANRATESETGIPFLTEAQKESAEAILKE